MPQAAEIRHWLTQFDEQATRLVVPVMQRLRAAPTSPLRGAAGAHLV